MMAHMARYERRDDKATERRRRVGDRYGYGIKGCQSKQDGVAGSREGR